MTIAITGATGKLGRLVVEQLRAKIPATEILALARTPTKARDLGVSVREADYSRPETLGPALAGVQSLLLISANEIGQRTAQHRNIIEAAKGAGVGAIAYTSLLHADSSTLTLAGEHRQTESLITTSGLSYTILRNGWYTENYAGSAKAAVAGGAVIGSAGHGKISSATRADYAAAAAAVLTGRGHAGKVYELAGDDSYTLSDLAAEISHQIGSSIPYKNLPEAEYARVLEGLGLPAALAGALASFDVAASKGALFDEGRQLSRLIGRPTTALSSVVRQALA